MQQDFAMRASYQWMGSLKMPACCGFALADVETLRCDRMHPVTVDNSGATKLYKALLPGINKILEGKAPAEYPSCS